ncbi:MAG TPA: DUF1501 domain-containing protein [Verrucomicrobiae bacterium]|nr:DUF1501 domain-containing protein [Verrucomicrobiae bacterium]
MNHDSERSGLRCDGWSRRDFLHLGVISGLGFSLADLFRCTAGADQSPTGQDLSCILIWLDGGPSHLEMFDPKPEAPLEIRGEFNAIGTRVDGIQICEHLPRTAGMMREIALIRSLTHELGNHDTGSHYLLTGHRPAPAVPYPSLGSVMAREAGLLKAIPPYIAIPDAVPAAGAGYLSGAFAPFAAGGDATKASNKVRDLDLPSGITFDRMARRRSMQQQLDAFSRQVEESAATRSRDAFYEQAYRLMTSSEAKAAFDLGREPQSIRARYGGQRIGTGCLLARRLIEAGARFVTVVDHGWDMHQQIFKAMPDAFFQGSGKLPALDMAYAALLGDLKERGLLDTTLVVMMGEFGRTPKINNAAGRDHWPRAGSVLFSGGGVRGGQLIGATDAHGETPAERPVRPEDIAYSILKLLGVDPDKEYMAPNGRPLKIVAGGSFIRELV